MNHRGPDISDDFLAQLKDDLVCRRVERGMAALEKRQHQWSSINPHQQNVGVFVGYLALWVDIGFQRPATIKSILAQIPTSQRAQLCVRDYVFVRMAEAMVAMAEQAPEQAIPHLDFVLALAEEIEDSELLSVANFWKGRCLRKKADYEQALVFTTRGRDIALSLGHKPMAAVMRVLESWLFFQKGKLEEATRILKEAETVLNKTDDYLTLGNIHSAHGRIARQQARYQHAIDHFDTAIAEYRKRDLQHRNVARTLANLAYVKRLIALQLRRKIDSDVAQRQKAASGGPSYLDNGDLDNADVEAAKAFTLGEQKKDYIIMARARVLLCMIENARVEEEIGEGTDSGIHARLAQDCIQEAIELVKHTQDRRLMGDAYIWLGLTYCNSFFADIDSAREAYDFAQQITKGEYSENSREDMQTLKSRLVRKGNVDPILRAWSQGSIGDKTFQQITEEFAEIIIPKIYEREGRKVSRVAKRLSISPKKVRRILSHVGRQRPSK
jgi:tetratricopeptide (TPR) repeat protein